MWVTGTPKLGSQATIITGPEGGRYNLNIYRGKEAAFTDYALQISGLQKFVLFRRRWYGYGRVYTENRYLQNKYFHNYS